jgi:hypothetical protein
MRRIQAVPSPRCEYSFKYAANVTAFLGRDAPACSGVSIPSKLENKSTPRLWGIDTL